MRIFLSILLLFGAFSSDAQLAFFRGRPAAAGGGSSYQGILDVVALAPDAYYALRPASSTDTSAAIRVRRSSDNTEQDIGFTGTNLNTASLLSFCGVGDGFITTWYDKSGNSRHITNSTAANQPQIVSSGNLITTNLNGKACILWDGVNDKLSNGGWSMVTNITSFVMVARNWPVGADQYLVSAGNYGAATGYNIVPSLAFDYSLLNVTAISGSGYGHSGATVAKQLIPTPATNVFKLIDSQLGANGSTMFVNSTNAAPTATSAATAAGTGAFVMGQAQDGAAKFVGYTAELVIWSNDTNTINTANRALIRSNINNYYLIY